MYKIHPNLGKQGLQSRQQIFPFLSAAIHFSSFLISLKRNQLRNKHFLSFCTSLTIASVLQRKLNGSLKVLLTFHFRKQSHLVRPELSADSAPVPKHRASYKSKTSRSTNLRQSNWFLRLLFLYLDSYETLQQPRHSAQVEDVCKMGGFLFCKQGKLQNSFIGEKLLKRPLIFKFLLVLCQGKQGICKFVLSTCTTFVDG